MTLQEVRDLFSVQPRTIRFRIVTLVAIIVVPLMALVAWLAVKYAVAQRDFIAAQRAEITNRLTAAADRDISVMLGMLTGIAGSRDLLAGNIDEFRRQAATLATHPLANRIWAFDKSGAVVVGSGAPSDAGAEALLPDMVAKVFDGSPAVSPISGKGLRNAHITVAVPMLDGERVVFGVAATVRVTRLGESFAREGLQSTWIAAIVDRNGNFVARSQDAELRVGDAARPELQRAAQSPSNSGTFDNVTWEGVHTLNDYRRSNLTGWTTVVAVPEDELARPMSRTIGALFLGSCAILGGTLAIALTFAARIAGPVSDLSAYARALAAGHASDEGRHHIVELDEVRDTLQDAMAYGARLSAIVASSTDAIISMDPDGTVRSWNQGAERLLGYSEQEIVGRPKTLIVPEQRLAEFETQRLQITSGETVQCETERRHKNGTLIDVALAAAPIRQPDGTIFGVSSILHDISEIKAAEAHTHFLMRELAHRSKNQLAIIQSIASQTARRAPSLDEFVKSFNQRLQGLSASHDLLTDRHQGEQLLLGDLVQRQLGVFVEWPSERLSASGPPVPLNASAAQALGLALHELATNAAKYGALSSAGGHISLSWSLKDSGGGPNLVLDWRESGGPAVTPPSRRGFGSQVIERVVASSLRGKSSIEFRADGLHWHFECPRPS